MSSLTPDQRAKIRGFIQSRLSEDVKEGLPDKLSERLAERVGNVQLPSAATASHESQTAIREAINERLAGDLPEQLADRLTDGASKLANLSSEQRVLVLAGIRGKLADEVRGRLGDQLAEVIGAALN